MTEFIYKIFLGVGVVVLLISGRYYLINNQIKKIKRDIVGLFLFLSAFVGSLSTFYWFYTLFVGGFDLRIFWYITVIPSTIGSVFDSIDDNTFFWSLLKKRITTTGCLLIFGGIMEGIGIFGSSTYLTAKWNPSLIPIIIGLIPVLIDLYQQTDEDVS